MSDQQNEDEKIGADESLVGAANSRKEADYKVGPGRPPKEYQWKKGQSGNPSGRRRKKLSKEAILDDILSEPIILREDGKERKVTKYEALYRSLLAKAFKSDRAARLMLEEGASAGLGGGQGSGEAALLPSKGALPQSDMLFANLDLDLLSDGDKIELARAGQIIDLGGDFTALSPAYFARIKQIAEKGRGKDVTPNG